MTAALKQLIDAEAHAAELFRAIETEKLIAPGKMESELNREVFQLAHNMFGVERYWHKRIVRAGPNTMHPYREDPPDLRIQADDILFFDFGPVFEAWEADFGRTYVLGNDPVKHKLRSDIEEAWFEARDWYLSHAPMSGAELFTHALHQAEKRGWEFGGEIAGHIIGQFPHERLGKGDKGHYIHPENHNSMSAPGSKGEPRHWILEIHFVDRQRQIGGFFEQLLLG